MTETRHTMKETTAKTTIGPLALSVIDESLHLSAGQLQTSAKNALLGTALLILLVAPMVLQGYFIGLLILAFIFSIFAISVDLVWGYAGILTFGHAAFFGLGAYITGTVATELTVETIGLVGLTLAFVASALVGGVIAGALFARGISEEYFTIITLAVAIVASQGAVILSNVTGGANGLSGIPSVGISIPGVLSYAVSGDQFYFVALGALVAVFLVGKRIVNSPFGTVLVGIDENETKISSLGYDPTRYKTLVFALSTGVAAFAGALYALHSGFISPPILGFVLSTEVLIWVLIGGRGTLVGPAIGATILVLAENMFSGIFLSTWVLLLGASLIVVVLVFPTGITGLFGIAEQKIISTIENT